MRPVPQMMQDEDSWINSSPVPHVNGENAVAYEDVATDEIAALSAMLCKEQQLRINDMFHTEIKTIEKRVDGLNPCERNLLKVICRGLNWVRTIIHSAFYTTYTHGGGAELLSEKENLAKEELGSARDGGGDEDSQGCNGWVKTNLHFPEVLELRRDRDNHPYVVRYLMNTWFLSQELYAHVLRFPFRFYMKFLSGMLFFMMMMMELPEDMVNIFQVKCQSHLSEAFSLVKWAPTFMLWDLIKVKKVLPIFVVRARFVMVPE
ncbi:hypothetical protein JB92DRAFT_2826818 [Gautieria morchelliformis]|nr:hypothetical protein JB92DRAFT_2826818 [Gautieria morchelliformis]